MRFSGKDSHVRRLTKAESSERGIKPTSEKYIVTKTYTDPYEGRVYREGEVISNRQGRNVQVQETANYRSYSEYNRIWSPRAKLTKKEVENRDYWVRRSAKRTGKTRESIRQDNDVRKAWTQLYQIDKGKRDYSRRGNMHYLLVSLGLRDPNAQYRVGDTPNATKAK